MRSGNLAGTLFSHLVWDEVRQAKGYSSHRPGNCLDRVDTPTSEFSQSLSTSTKHFASQVINKRELQGRKERNERKKERKGGQLNHMRKAWADLILLRSVWDFIALKRITLLFALINLDLIKIPHTYLSYIPRYLSLKDPRACQFGRKDSPSVIP